MSDNSIIVKCKLKNEYITKYNHLQKLLNLDSNADTIREMIDISYEFVGFNTKFVEVPQILYENLKALVNRPEIRRKLNISEMDELVRWILHQKIEELEKEKKSLIHWDVKKELNSEEKEIANALSQLLMDYQGGVTASQVAEVLNPNAKPDRFDLLKDKVSNILDQKFEQGYLERDKNHNGEILYFAW